MQLRQTCTALPPRSPPSVRTRRLWPALQQLTLSLAHVKFIHPHLMSWVCPCHSHVTEENTEAQKGHVTAQGWTASSGSVLPTSTLTALDKATQTVLKAGLANNDIRALVWARGLAGSRGGGRGRNQGLQGQEHSEAVNFL